jgi:voltage-gated potassium channel
LLLMLPENFRTKLYTVIFKADTAAGKRFDLALLWLIILSILTVLLDSISAFRTQYGVFLRVIEWIFTIVFSIEYVLRIYSSRQRLRYIFSFYGFIDLISVIPTYLSLLFPGFQYLLVIRSMRLLRVFRILKLTRFLNEGTILKNALQASMYKITVFLLTVITLVIIAGTLMYVIEGEEGGFTSIPIAIYWAIVTITTVGYGDISPLTPLGQFIASILMITGYGIIAVPTGIVTVEMSRAAEAGRKRCINCGFGIYPENANFCSNCGVKR